MVVVLLQPLRQLLICEPCGTQAQSVASWLLFLLLLLLCPCSRTMQAGPSRPVNRAAQLSDVRSWIMSQQHAATHSSGAAAQAGPPVSAIGGPSACSLLTAAL